MDARDHSHFVDFPVNLSTDVREPTGMSFAKRSSKKWPALNSMFPGVFFRVLQSKAMGVRRRPPKKQKFYAVFRWNCLCLTSQKPG